MKNDELCFTPATRIAALVRNREISAVEVTQAVLDRIEAIDSRLNAICTVAADEALEAAQAVDAALAGGEDPGPLGGVPVSVKDLVATKGIRTTFGSRIHENDVPDFDGPLVERLKRAGAIVIGKTNTPEFGHMGVTHNQVFGVTRNPWSLDHSPGGSSGGAGAAVAAGLGPLAVGSDGGGSIRIPSSFSGIFGLKPNLGRIPQYPVGIGLEWMSHAGPMTRTVEDAGLMLDVMAGPDERDMSTLPPPPSSFQDAARMTDVSDLRIGWSPTLGYATVDAEVAEITERAARKMGNLGCKFEQIEHVFDDPGPAWYTLFCMKFAATHRDDLDRVRDILEPGYLGFVEAGFKMSAVDCASAGWVRRLLAQRMGEVLGEFDILLTPTMAVPPLPIGVDNPETINGRKISIFGWTPFTYPFNMTGQPAASVPCGFTKDGRPVGLQIVGRRFDEYTVLRASAAYELAAPWAQQRPPAPFG